VGSTVYVPFEDGVRAVSIGSTGAMTLRWHASSNIAGSPVVGGGRVWALDTGAGTLYGLDPATGSVKNSVHVGSVTRFATPALYGHLAYVGTTTGYAIVEST
jgi:outer membrane protein assembly factor BamB